jgi:hypothetical protein
MMIVTAGELVATDYSNVEFKSFIRTASTNIQLIKLVDNRIFYWKRYVSQKLMGMLAGGGNELFSNESREIALKNESVAIALAATYPRNISFS